MIMRTNNKRVRKPAERPELTSRVDVEACVRELAELVIERNGLMADMDAKLTAVRAEYEERLADLNGDIDAELKLAEQWAEANRGEFGDKRSLDLVHGTIGFRTGNPTLKTLSRVTWARVLENLVVMKLFPYIRTKQEPDRERLLADREKLGETLKALGVRVEQGESFFCEPRLDPIPEAAHANRG